MVTNMIEMDDICLFRRIGHEFWDKRFLLIRDKAGLSVLDLNSLLISKILDSETDTNTIEVDIIQKKVMVYVSAKIEGEMKIKRVELK